MTNGIHRCGGTLEPSWFLLERTGTGKVRCFYQVPALQCVKCGEKVIERDVIKMIEAHFEGTGTFQLPICIFGQPISSGLLGIVLTGSTQLAGVS